MKQRNKPFEEIYDLLAIRIVTPLLTVIMFWDWEFIMDPYSGPVQRLYQYTEK